jgi:predicted AAA+ superfamily ATPase
MEEAEMTQDTQNVAREISALLRSLKKNTIVVGAPGVGKTTLLKENFPDATWIDQGNEESWLKTSTGKTEVIILERQMPCPELKRLIGLLGRTHPQTRILLTFSDVPKKSLADADFWIHKFEWIRVYPFSLKEYWPKSAPEGEFFRKTSEFLICGGMPSHGHLQKQSHIWKTLSEEVFAQRFHYRAKNPYTSSELERLLKLSAMFSGEIANDCALAQHAAVAMDKTKKFCEQAIEKNWAVELPFFSHRESDLICKIKRRYWLDTGWIRFVRGFNPFEELSEEFFNSLRHQILIEILTYLEQLTHRIEVAHWHSKAKQKIDFVLVENKVPILAVTAQKFEAPRTGIAEFSRIFPRCPILIVCEQTEPPQRRNKPRAIAFEEFFLRLWEENLW